MKLRLCYWFPKLVSLNFTENNNYLLVKVVSSRVLIAAGYWGWWIKATGRILAPVVVLLSFEHVEPILTVQLPICKAGNYIIFLPCERLRDIDSPGSWKICLENCMILNVSFSLHVFPGLTVGTDGQRQAIKSTECSKNNPWLLHYCAVLCTVVHVHGFGK